MECYEAVKKCARCVFADLDVHDALGENNQMQNNVCTVISFYKTNS